ncbi:CAP-Gly domain-containing linker protein 2-like [Ornithodoros turicata]|uniref:CAP-Gly domain-containing linker protein 2-like n=1 Tax=Ornithodoros turicata TaxID=34597 RepID=UPI003139C069
MSLASEGVAGSTHSTESAEENTDGDRRYARKATRFVVKHLEKGVVPLCVAVAELFEKLESLRREVQTLQEALQQGTEVQSQTEQRGTPVKFGGPPSSTETVTTLPLDGCLCSACKNSTPPYFSLGSTWMNVTVILPRMWDNVGVVRYVGHLDCSSPCKLWAGVRLDEPVGWTDGSLQGERYFTCEPNHGIFVPLSRILPVQALTKKLKSSC